MTQTSTNVAERASGLDRSVKNRTANATDELADEKRSFGRLLMHAESKIDTDNVANESGASSRQETTLKRAMRIDPNAKSFGAMVQNAAVTSTAKQAGNASVDKNQVEYQALEDAATTADIGPAELTVFDEVPVPPAHSGTSDEDEGKQIELSFVLAEKTAISDPVTRTSTGNEDFPHEEVSRHVIANTALLELRTGMIPKQSVEVSKEAAAALSSNVADAVRSVEAPRRSKVVDVSVPKLSSSPGRLMPVGAGAAIALTETTPAAVDSVTRNVQRDHILERSVLDGADLRGRADSEPDKRLHSTGSVLAPTLPNLSRGHVAHAASRDVITSLEPRWSEPRAEAEMSIGGVKQEIHAAPANLQSGGVARAYEQIVSSLVGSGDMARTSVIAMAQARPAHSIVSPAPLKILQIQLQPKELGDVAVRMALRGDRVELLIQTTRPSTADILKNDHKFLVDALQRESFDIEAVTVQLVEPERNTGATSFTTTAAGQSKATADGSHSSESQSDAQRRGGGKDEEGRQSQSDHRQGSWDHDPPNTGGRGKDLIL